jgi:Glycosyltransferase family 87
VFTLDHLFDVEWWGAHRRRPEWTSCRVKTEPRVSFRGLGSALSKPWIAFVILGVAIIRLASLYYGLYRDFAPEDFSVYYASGFLLRHGVNPYMADLAATAHRLGLETGYISQATDPPTFLLMFEPPTLMPVHESYWVWQAINLAAFVVALVLLFAPKFSGLPRPLAITLTGLAMVYAPVGNNFAIAQNKILVLLLLVAMYRCMERRYDGWAGIFLAIAGLMRVFPLLLIFYLAFRSRWRVLGFVMGGLIAGGMITLGLLGIRNGIGFINTGVSFLTQQRWYSNSANIAIAAVVSRAFWYFGEASLGAGLEVARRIVIALADLGVVLALISATPARDEEDPDWRILSFWIAASVALSPTAWFHYLVLMLIPIAQMAEAATHNAVSARCLGLVAASFILTGLIGDAARTFPGYVDAIKQLEFVCMAMVIVACYWFSTETGREKGGAAIAVRLKPQSVA